MVKTVAAYLLRYSCTTVWLQTAEIGGTIRQPEDFLFMFLSGIIDANKEKQEGERILEEGSSAHKSCPELYFHQSDPQNCTRNSHYEWHFFEAFH